MGALSVTHEQTFTQLLTVDGIRGVHSTGMASYNPGTKDINIAKETGDPYGLIRSSDYLKSMSKINSLLLGHNRYATKGAINKDNAHPFKQSHIIGAHNGSLTYMGQQRLEDKDNKFSTDSEAIFWSIATRGFEETYKILANPVFAENAFALTWFNTQTNKFHIIRNKKRPLYYAYTEKKDAMFWASEYGALQWIMGRNGLRGDQSKTFVINEDTLYEWDITEKRDALIADAPKMELQETPVAFYEPPKIWNGYPNHSHHSNVTPPFQLESEKDKKTTNVLKFPSVERVNNFRPPYKSDRGYVIGKKAVTALTEQGCLYCGEKEFKWGEFAYFTTFGTSNVAEYICTDCYLDEDVKQLVMDCSNV